MNQTRFLVATLLAGATLGAAAQTPITPVPKDRVTAGISSQRDVNQQQRIENGLAAGSLSTGEAAQLEKDQARVDRMESQALQDGRYSTAEKNRIDAAQDAASRDIYEQKHDDKTGHPNSDSSQRMQQQVQRNLNQQQRIHDGLVNDSLTPHEAARLERRQSFATRLDAAAGADGHMGRWEQRQLNHIDDRQSRQIFRQKHDRQNRKGG